MREASGDSSSGTLGKIMQRSVIIGNSGSGKTYLSRVLGLSSAIPVIHLDQLFWEPSGFNQKRSKEIVLSDIAAAKSGPKWIAEGVFGELAEMFFDKADSLVWLDLPWLACRENLIARGSESAAQMDKQKAEENFMRLLTWAENYTTRTDLRSHAGHEKLYQQFSGAKIRLEDRPSIEAFINEKRA